MYPGIGVGVGLGKDHTFVALVRGDVRLRAGLLGRKYVSVAAANDTIPEAIAAE
jgi:ribosomal protein L27